MLQIRPTARGVMQDPPLPIHVELGVDVDVDKASLKKSIESMIRERLLVTTAVTLVQYNALPRETYKSKLVDYSDVPTV